MPGTRASSAHALSACAAPAHSAAPLRDPCTTLRRRRCLPYCHVRILALSRALAGARLAGRPARSVGAASVSSGPLPTREHAPACKASSGHAHAQGRAPGGPRRLMDWKLRIMSARYRPIMPKMPPLAPATARQLSSNAALKKLPARARPRAARWCHLWRGHGLQGGCCSPAHALLTVAAWRK